MGLLLAGVLFLEAPPANKIWAGFHYGVFCVLSVRANGLRRKDGGETGEEFSAFSILMRRGRELSAQFLLPSTVDREIP
jgi:hypothetical protein